MKKKMRHALLILAFKLSVVALDSESRSCKAAQLATRGKVEDDAELVPSIVDSDS